jgi:Flp pilus assembly protein TadG
MRRSRDRGAVSIWVVIFAFITVVLLILLVDGGQVMIAKSRAADIAEQAARAAADDINPASLRSGGQIALAAGACGPAGPAAGLVSSYAKGVGVTASMQGCSVGTAEAPGAGTTSQVPEVQVTVQVSTRAAIPDGLFSTIQVSASESAYLACGSADALAAC